MITVYYDGKCGLCRREIDHYRKRTPLADIRWVDVATDPEKLEGTNVTQTEALKYMCVFDDAGTKHMGINAFLVIWRQFKGWRRVAAVAGLPVVRHVLAGLYFFFANVRFRLYPHCRLAQD